MAPEAGSLRFPERPPGFVPRRVFLFSGHRVDAVDRPRPRFPPSAVPAAAARIAAVLAREEAGADDLALAQAASGGDLLFLEAARARGLCLRVMLPFDEDAFLRCSVLSSAGGEEWLARYRALCAALAVAPLIATAPEVAMSPALIAHADPFERCNLWLLETARQWGDARVRFICLWDGATGDGPGGTAMMRDAVVRAGGDCVWIDVRTLTEAADTSG
ncbi:MAG: hypothetical protein ACK4KV_16000 [Rhodocyclaceae bacterium]